MKKKIIISVVLTVIMLVSMSFGCFAGTYDGYLFYQGKTVTDSYSLTPLGTIDNDFMYTSYNNVIYYYMEIYSELIDDVYSNVKLTETTKLLDISYSTAYVYYESLSDYVTWEQYARDFAYLLGTTTLYSHNGNYTTGSDYTSQQQAMDVNRLIRFEINTNAYYKNVFSGQLNYNIVFGVESGNTQFHYFY